MLIRSRLALPPADNHHILPHYCSSRQGAVLGNTHQANVEQGIWDCKWESGVFGIASGVLIALHCVALQVGLVLQECASGVLIGCFRRLVGSFPPPGHHPSSVLLIASSNTQIHANSTQIQND